MDKRSFDIIVRGFAPQQSRRAALKGLAAAAFGFAVVREAGAQPGVELADCGNRCNSDADCNAGFRCGAGSRRCFAIPDSRDRCDANIGCTNNYEVCNRNDRCVNRVKCDECERNGDCSAGQQCRDGRCKAPECTRNSDCRRREKCRRGRCIARN